MSTPVKEIRQRLHSANGALSVIDTFVRSIDGVIFDTERSELYRAALRSLERMKGDLITLQDIVRLLG